MESVRKKRLKKSASFPSSELYGYLWRQRFDLAFSLLHDHASLGDPYAMLHIALAHQRGSMGQTKNVELAKLWMKKAASKKVGYALFLMGDLYTPYHEREKWFKKSWQNSGDLFVKGLCHLHGRCTNQNEEKAFQCFKAEASYTENPSYCYDEALRMTGYCVSFGVGTEVDLDEGLMYIEKSAHLGNGAAQKLAGTLLTSHMERPLAGWKWFRKAVNQGMDIGEDIDELFPDYERHERVRDVIFLLLLSRKKKLVFQMIPLDLVRLIAQYVYSTKDEECWHQ